MRVTRKRIVILAVLLLATVAFGWIVPGALVDVIGGAFSGSPRELHDRLSPGARALIDQAYVGIDPAEVLDYHTHVVGVGAGGTGAWVNPEMASWTSPIKRAKFSIYLSASGVLDVANADQEFVTRLTELIRNNPRHGTHAIMAFDQRYTDDGQPDRAHSEFYVPNDYIFGLAETHADIFVPVMSIHPLRPDAIEALRRWAGRGGRYMKWLPNAMGISPDDPRLDAFYDVMVELDVVLISHTGEEQAVEADADQERGNPLRLRRPLDRGVKVIAAHCASLGTSEDLDDPAKPQADNFDLLVRLFETPKYDGRLFADISAMTQFNRVGRPLATILDREDLHPRLVNGSDYPLPAINALVSTRELVRQGFITDVEREQLNEIYAFDPLLFDFVTKRTLRSPGSSRSLPAEVFMRRPGL